MKNFTSLLFITFSLSVPISAVEIIDRVAIIVGEGVVLESQVDSMLKTIKSRLTEQGIQMPPDEVLLDQVNERLIIEELQLQMGNRAGIKISDGELNVALESIAENNKLSLDEFVTSFEESGQSYIDFRNQVRKEMIIQRVQRGRVATNIEITEQEVNNFLRSEEAVESLYPEYEVLQILVPTLSIANTLLEIIDQKDFISLVQEFSIASNAKNGGSLGYRKLNEMPSIFADELRNQTVGYVSKPLKTGAGYQILKLNNKRGPLFEIVDQWRIRHILMSPSKVRDNIFTRQEIQSVRMRALDKENFNDLAKEFSEDPGSASKGGDLGWIELGVTDLNFEEMFLSSRVGEISPIFETQFGFHFLEVLEKRKFEKTFDNIENQAYNLLFSRKYDEELENTLRMMRAEAFVEYKDLY